MPLRLGKSLPGKADTRELIFEGSFHVEKSPPGPMAFTPLGNPRALEIMQGREPNVHVRSVHKSWCSRNSHLSIKDLPKLELSLLGVGGVMHLYHESLAFGFLFHPSLWVTAGKRPILPEPQHRQGLTAQYVHKDSRESYVATQESQKHLSQELGLLPAEKDAITALSAVLECIPCWRESVPTWAYLKSVNYQGLQLTSAHKIQSTCRTCCAVSRNADLPAPCQLTRDTRERERERERERD